MPGWPWEVQPYMRGFTCITRNISFTFVFHWPGFHLYALLRVLRALVAKNVFHICPVLDDLSATRSITLVNNQPKRPPAQLRQKTTEGVAAVHNGAFFSKLADMLSDQDAAGR